MFNVMDLLFASFLRLKMVVNLSKSKDLWIRIQIYKSLAFKILFQQDRLDLFKSVCLIRVIEKSRSLTLAVTYS